MRKAMIPAALAVAAMGATACSTLGRQAFQNPDVKVQDVRVTGLGLTGGQLDVVVNVANPNDFRLDATRMTYKLLVDSVTFADGTVDQKFTVEGGKSTQFHVPVSFTYAGIGAAGRSLLNTGAVPYKVTGVVTVGTVIGNFNVPYQTTGRVTTFGGSSQ